MDRAYSHVQHNNPLRTYTSRVYTYLGHGGRVLIFFIGIAVITFTKGRQPFPEEDDAEEEDDDDNDDDDDAYDDDK